MKDFPLCKKSVYLNGITLGRFQYLQKNLVLTGIVLVDKRGKHDRPRKLPNSTVNTVYDFIKSL